MRVTKKSLVIVAVAVCCLFVIWLSTSIQGGQRTYEVRPEVTIPEHRTDAGRAIDAYERLMDRYMDLTERNLFRVGTDLQEVVKKLDAIDEKLTKLAARIGRIENALDIKKPYNPLVEKIQPQVPNQKTIEELPSQH
jgi:ABC-type transporter Mla subunit MlaD